MIKKVKNKQLFNHNNCPYFLSIYDSDLDDRLFELHKPLMGWGNGWDTDERSYFASWYDELIEIAKERSPHDVINIEIMKEYILKIDQPNPRDIDTKVAILYDEYMGTFELVNNYEVYNNYFPFYLLYLRQNPNYQDKKTRNW